MTTYSPPQISVPGGLTRAPLPTRGGSTASYSAGLVSGARRRGLEKAFNAPAVKRPPVPRRLPIKIPGRKLPGFKVPSGGIALKGLGALGVISIGVGIMEVTAPGVHDWLLGGWKGAKPTSEQTTLEGGQCSTLYSHSFRFRVRGTSDGFSGIGLTEIYGPISSIKLIVGYPSGQPRWFFEYLTDGPEGNRVVNAGLNPQFWELDYSRISRSDGLPDNCGNRTENLPVGYPGKPQAPPQSPDPTEGLPGIRPRPGTPQTGSPTTPKDKPRGFPIPDFFGDPLPPFFPGLLPTDKPRPDPQPEPDPNPFPSDPGGCTSGCNATLKAGQNALNDKLRDQTNKLNDLLAKLDAAANAEIIRRLQIVDEKLGPQITGPTGSKIGIAGKLIDFASSADKWFRRLGGDSGATGVNPRGVPA